MDNKIDNMLSKIHLNEENGQYNIRMSYSKLSTFENCKQSYKLHYVDGILPADGSTIALELGSLCHKCLELMGQDRIHGRKTDLNYINKILEEGYTGSNVSDTEVLPGIKAIKMKYGFEEWLKQDDQGNNYVSKLKTFTGPVLASECCQNEPEWSVLDTEVPFEFIYEIEVPESLREQIGYDVFKVLFNGFIDRIDVKEVDGKKYYRVVDYKTSKKPFPEKNLPTALQMFIYGMAIYLKFGEFPIEYKYSFILLDKKQTALTKGYIERGFKKIDALLTELLTCMATNEWPEKPSPLCHWCAYCDGREVVDPITNGLCNNYSLWTPENPTFATSGSSLNYDKPFGTKNDLTKTKRKLIF